MKITLIDDPEDYSRRARTRRLVDHLNLEVDASLLIDLIDSGSAPTKLAGGLGRPFDAEPLVDDGLGE